MFFYINHSEKVKDNLTKKIKTKFLKKEKKLKTKVGLKPGPILPLGSQL